VRSAVADTKADAASLLKRPSRPGLDRGPFFPFNAL